MTTPTTGRRPEIILGYGSTTDAVSSPIEDHRFDSSMFHRDLSHVIVIPTRGVIDARIVDSWMSTMRPPNSRSTQIIVARMEVGAAYNMAIEQILSHPGLATWPYIVTLEEDNLIGPVDLVRLLQATERDGWDVLSALYFTKGIDGIPQIWGDRTDPEVNFRPQHVNRDGRTIECWGTGMGFTVFRTDLFRRVPSPWFETMADTRGFWTQDLSFFAKAHAAIPNLKVGVHCGIRSGHLDYETGEWW